jgi:hypothetical protein
MLTRTDNYLIGAVMLSEGGRLVKSEQRNGRTTFYIENDDADNAEAVALMETKRLAQAGGHGIVLDIGTYTAHLRTLHEVTKKSRRT